MIWIVGALQLVMLIHLQHVVALLLLDYVDVDILPLPKLGCFVAYLPHLCLQL